MPDLPVSFLAAWRAAVVTVDARPNVRVSTSTVRHVGLTLSLHMDARGGSCYPGIPLLARETGYEGSAVSRAVAELRHHGLIEVTRTGRSNRYQAVLPAVDKSVDDGENPVSNYPMVESTARSDVADGQIRHGPGPHEGVQEGVHVGLEVQDLLLLGVDFSNGTPVAAIVAESLEAVA